MLGSFILLVKSANNFTKFRFSFRLPRDLHGSGLTRLRRYQSISKTLAVT